MKNRTLLGEATIAGSDRVLKLYQGKDGCTIFVSGRGELMSTRRHASEDALATLACQMLQTTNEAQVLIGGLGMGFTLAAALSATGPNSSIVVAELVPEVVEWNRGPLGEYSNYPLNDARTTVYHGDVIDLLQIHDGFYDVIALDVDNGPEALSTTGNNWLYTIEGIACARERLTSNGVLAYWSATPDKNFVKLLRECGLNVIEKSVYAHGNKGTKHTIWLATAFSD